MVPGGSIWAFGDTFKGSRSADGKPHFAGGAISCSIAFHGKHTQTYPPALRYLSSSSGIAISPFEILPDERPVSRHRICPLGGIYVHGQYYLFYSLIDLFGNKIWDFRSVGSGLGRSKTALGSYERLQPRGHWRFPAAPTQVLEADGWLYLFSMEKFKTTVSKAKVWQAVLKHGTAPYSFRQGVSLARARPGRIEDPKEYQFYAGPGPDFLTRRDAGVCLVSNVFGQVSVAWNPYLKKYVMASSSDPGHPRQICLREAEAPYGP